MFVSANGITLRKIEKEDLSILKEYKNTSWGTVHHTVFLNNADQQKWFDSINNSNTQLVFMAEYSNNTVGVYILSNIDWINRSCEASYGIFKPFRGKGYGKKLWEAGTDLAFSGWNMYRITAEVLADNKASIEIIEKKCQFKKEGIKREAVYKNGKYVDSIVYGRLIND